MKISIRRLAKWVLWGFAVVTVLFGLYLSVFFLPYPLFPHHMEHAGFSVYSDGEIPEDFELVFEDARFRAEGMELYRGAKDLRIFICRSQRLFVFFNKLTGKRHVGQALVISVAGNAFFSEEMIESVGRRNHGRPVHSRLAGSWSGAIAHEVAHDLVFSEVGYWKARQMPVWKSEGFADYSANLASAGADPDYDFRSRIGLLLDDDSWQSAVGFVDRRHFRWHLLVEFLCSVKGLTFADLMDAGVTEKGARAEMMAWYSAPQINDDGSLSVVSNSPGRGGGKSEIRNPNSSVIRPVLQGPRLVAHDRRLVAADHGVGGDAAAMAISFNRLAQSAAKGDLVAVVRTSDHCVGTKAGAASFVFWSEQCHRVPPLAILPGLIPEYIHHFDDRIHRYRYRNRYRDRFAGFQERFSIAIAKAIPIANGTSSLPRKQPVKGVNSPHEHTNDGRIRHLCPRTPGPEPLYLLPAVVIRARPALLHPPDSALLPLSHAALPF